MINIVLLCAQGMSTGMLMNKMREQARKEDFECTIEAYSVSQASQIADKADCILLGPQVRYELDSVKKECPNVPIEVIDMISYGRLDGAKVLSMAKQLINKDI